MSTTAEILTNQYGVLMTYEQLSDVMHRSAKGMRLSLAQGNCEWAKRINAARRKIGRRVLFKTADIAKIVDDGII
ncbi:MAG: DNA-binding protein [Pseudomonas sp.]|uniref:DNA-binding protein n=1 Tax=Pseudomonas sp. TaxID=306 RepID=UPI003981A24C